MEMIIDIINILHISCCILHIELDHRLQFKYKEEYHKFAPVKLIKMECSYGHKMFR